MGDPSGDPPAAAAGDPRGDSAAPKMIAPAFCASSLEVDETSVARRIFEGLTPAPAADYVALRRLEVSLPSRRDEDPGLVTLGERGKVCATARDGTKCEKAYRGLATQDVWLPLVFFTRGDTVGIARTPASAMALLGTIDSPEEAFFIAGVSGYRFSCRGANAAGYRDMGDGFELVAEAGGCGKPVERITVRVHANGDTEETSRVTTEAVTDSCPQP